MVLSLVAAAAVVPLGLAYANLTQDLPNVEQLAVLLDGEDGQLRQPTRLFDRTGEQALLTLELPGSPPRKYLALAGESEDILPQALVDATIAISDPGFWEHAGYAPNSLKDGGQRSLAERLVTDLLLWAEEDGLEKRLRARLLAAQATDHYGREKLLEWYLNSADYGHLLYGAEAAAQAYLGKPASDLTLAEAALLAAVSGAAALNPVDAPELAIERQQHVLEAMLAQGLITTEEALEANTNPLQIQVLALPEEDRYAAFNELALEQAAAYFGEGRLNAGGLRIITTMDHDLQVQASCASAMQLARLRGETQAAESEGAAKCQAGRLLPALRSDEITGEAGLSANVVALDTSTGQVLALVGGSGTWEARHTPGTLLTPWVYLTAFTRGFSPASLTWDIPSSVPVSLSGLGNLGGEYHGPVTMRAALANNYLAATLKTLGLVGPENVWRTARQSGMGQLGLTAYGDEAYRLLYEGGAVALLQAVHAYGIFGNQGLLAGQAADGPVGEEGQGQLTPAAILSVEDYAGRRMLDWEQPEIRAVTSAQLAYLVTDILSDEVGRRPSLGHPNALEIGRPAGAKLGETPGGQENWAVGYTPQQIVGVWLGYEQAAEAERQPLSPLAAAGLWNAIIKYSHADLEVRGWELPVGVLQMNVCVPSGMLPTVDCPTTADEIFLPGNEPIQLDTLYQSLQVNYQTGRLATVFTPPELIEERVYLVVPPDAVEWARAAGLPVPPEVYDVVFNPGAPSNEVRISSPEMFSYAHGRLEIRGSATGEEFSYYRVQVGEGLNPRQWLQIGENESSPVDDGLLAVWDSGNANGLFAIRLQVVRQDQSIETAIIQVTVDNQAPVVEILSPAEGQGYVYPDERTVILQARASDQLGVAKVEFFIDGELVSSLTQTPFVVPWAAGVGEHVLSVRVTDLAGNQSEAKVTFSVAR